MKIRPLISLLSIAGLGFFGVSCKSTGTAGNNNGGYNNDGGYVGGGADSSEYDNVYEMGGGDDSNYETANSNGGYDNNSSYNYESNDYSSNTYTPPAPQPTYTPPPTQPTYQPASTRSHTVERGDTLFNISRRYGTSVSAIQNANGLNGDLIRIGESLQIP